MIGYLLLIIVYVWILMGKTRGLFSKVAVAVAIIGLFLMFLTTRGGLNNYELIDLLLSF